MTTLLRTSALDAFYGDFQALFGVDFEIARGEIVAVIGANGAGKSTLLKSIAGLIANRHDALRWGDDAIGEFRDHAQVVGDQQDGHRQFLPQRSQQIEDLRLHRDVQGRGWFVGDQQRGFAGKRNRDHHALAHAAG